MDIIGENGEGQEGDRRESGPRLSPSCLSPGFGCTVKFRADGVQLLACVLRVAYVLE